MYCYNSCTALFHGKAEDLRKLAPLVWDKPELEELRAQLEVDPALASDAETTIHVYSCDEVWYELRCIDFIVDRSPNVEIAVMVAMEDTITGMEDRYSRFYPLDREFYEDDEDDYDFEDYMNYVRFYGDQSDFDGGRGKRIQNRPDR